VEAADMPFLHVFPYSERPGTPAARMPAVDKAVRKERAARLREAGDRAAVRFLAGHVGRDIALLTESNDMGHSEHFAPVRLVTPAEPGRVMAARVTRSTGSVLLAEAA
jgi:threonylcarbamoyladenosine tRNA methylthiotransferase MtaB